MHTDTDTATNTDRPLVPLTFSVVEAGEIAERISKLLVHDFMSPHTRSRLLALRLLTDVMDASERNGQHVNILDAWAKACTLHGVDWWGDVMGLA